MPIPSATTVLKPLIPMLCKLILNGQTLGDETIAPSLAGLLQQRSSLRMLGLHHVCMGNNGTKGIANSLKDHPTLEVLDASENPAITESGCHVLAYSIKTCQNLHTLCFYQHCCHNLLSSHCQSNPCCPRDTGLAEIIHRALCVNTSLQKMSHIDGLTKDQQLHLLLNCYDRKWLLRDPVSNSSSLLKWSLIFWSMPLEILAYYVRHQ